MDKKGKLSKAVLRGRGGGGGGGGGGGVVVVGGKVSFASIPTERIN